MYTHPYVLACTSKCLLENNSCALSANHAIKTHTHSERSVVTVVPSLFNSVKCEVANLVISGDDVLTGVPHKVVYFCLLGEVRRVKWSIT